MAAKVDTNSSPSFMRSVPGSVNVPVVESPSQGESCSASTNAVEVAADFVKSFNNALAASDYQAISNFFTDNGFWRDHLALSWRFRTAQGPSSILEFLKSTSQSRDGFRLKTIGFDETSKDRKPACVPIDGLGNILGVQFILLVQTSVGSGRGLCRLTQVNGQWKIFTFYTRLHDLTGHEQAKDHHRPKGADHGGQPGRKNWLDRRTAASNFGAGHEPQVLVVGEFKL